MKAEQKGQNNYGGKGIGKTKYSLERPPQVFIRRAVDSSDEEEGSSPRQKHGNRKRYKQAGKDSREGKQKQPQKQPVFNNDDFPSLN